MPRPFLIHALSSLHAGTGHSAGVIDLPIARMMATGIPFAPGSGIKGVLRDARTQNPEDGVNDWGERCKSVFGPDTGNAADHAGALVVGDARLLALPVRSFKGTFAWVTSPLLLTLAKRDLKSLGGAWASLDVPKFAGRGAKVGPGADGRPGGICVHTDSKVYLQDLDLVASADQHVAGWAAQLHRLFPPGEDDIFSPRFIAVDDDTMAFLWETATQVDQRIRIDQKTRTVADGALWSEESLPPETLLIGLLEASHSRNPRKDDMQPEHVLELALPLGDGCILQFGGKATVGRGRCRMVAIG
jgi:CRISPR-associated protein Cmr4